MNDKEKRFLKQFYCKFNKLWKIVKGLQSTLTLRIDHNEILDSTDNHLLYVKDGKLSEVPKFIYDEATDTLSYQDATGTVNFTIGTIEIAPTVFMPGMVFQADEGFSMGYVDQTLLGDPKSGLLGFLNDSNIRVNLNGNINIKAATDVIIESPVSTEILAGDDGAGTPSILVKIDGASLTVKDFINSSAVTHKLSVDKSFDLGGGAVIGDALGGIGFHNTMPLTQQVLPLGSSTDDVIQALQNLGLVRELP